VIAVIYIWLRCAVQRHEEAHAYSFDAHMGFVRALGGLRHLLDRGNTGSPPGAGMGLDGAMVQMVSHGSYPGAGFCAVGVLYDRVHSRQIADYGVVNTMPVFAAFCAVLRCHTGLPGPGFVGEIPVTLASFRAVSWYRSAAVDAGAGGAPTPLAGEAGYLSAARAARCGARDVNGREIHRLTALALAVLMSECGRAAA